MTTMLKKKDWSTLTRRALTATEIVANLAKLEGWSPVSYTHLTLPTTPYV